MITSFTKSEVGNIASEIQSAISGIATKHGIKLEVQKTKGDALSAWISIKAEVVIGAEDLKKDMFCDTCDIYGLEKDDYGKIFLSKGEPFKIVGIKIANRKYPIIAENMNGTSYKFPPAFVRNALALREKAAS